MNPRIPSLPALRALLARCEGLDLTLDAESLLTFPHASALIGCGALRELPVADTIWVPYHDDEVPVALELHPDPLPFGRYKCPASGRWIAVTRRDVVPYAVDLAWLAGVVAGWLTPTGTTPIDPLIADTLFDIGSHRVGERRVDVLLCRRFDHHCATLSGVLQSRRYRQPSLILTCGQPNKPLPAATGYFIVLPLAHCVIDESGETRLDFAYLGQALQMPRESLVPADEVYFDPASGELRLPGKPVTHFTGDQQVAVIACLYQACMQRSPDVKASELLKAAKTEAPTLPHLFSRRADWTIYIARSKRGWYRLNV